MTTAVGMGGPPVLLYLLSGGDAAARNRADIITTFAIIGSAALGVFLVAGAIGAETVSRALVLAPPFSSPPSPAGSTAIRPKSSSISSKRIVS